MISSRTQLLLLRTVSPLVASYRVTFLRFKSEQTVTSCNIARHGSKSAESSGINTWEAPSAISQYQKCGLN